MTSDWIYKSSIVTYYTSDDITDIRNNVLHYKTICKSSVPGCALYGSILYRFEASLIIPFNACEQYFPFPQWPYINGQCTMPMEYRLVDAHFPFSLKTHWMRIIQYAFKAQWNSNKNGTIAYEALVFSFMFFYRSSFFFSQLFSGTNNPNSQHYNPHISHIPGIEMA